MVWKFKKVLNYFKPSFWRNRGKQQSTDSNRNVPATQDVNPYKYYQPPPDPKPERGLFWKIPIKRSIGRTYRINPEIKYMGPMLLEPVAPLQGRFYGVLRRANMGSGKTPRSRIIARLRTKKLPKKFEELTMEHLKMVWQDVGLALHTAPVEVYNEYMKELDEIMTEIVKSRRLK
ncbi:MAG: hypothetical protein V1676_02365 [Candidatus Diapherotrites archaeon]